MNDRWADSAETDAVALLAERLEGNLLAASLRRSRKLRLLHGEQSHHRRQLVADTVSDNARYDAFRLVDVALSGDRSGRRADIAERAAGRGHSTAGAAVGRISREVRLLADLKREIVVGGSLLSMRALEPARRVAQPAGAGALVRSTAWAAAISLKCRRSAFRCRWRQ